MSLLSSTDHIIKEYFLWQKQSRFYISRTNF
jgi:hypothetical protein